MTKTLLITLDFPPRVGGVATYLSELCRRLPSEKCVVLAPPYDNSDDFDQSQPYQIYRKKLISKSPLIWPKWLPLLYWTYKIIRQEKIKYIQAGQILPIGTVALLINKIFNIPYLVYTYAMDVTIIKDSSRRKKLAQKILKKAKHIATISQFTKKELLNLGTDESKIVMVYPCSEIWQQVPANIEDIKNSIIKKYKLTHKTILLTIGRLEERKGHDMVIKALPQVLKEIPDLVYIIGSQGPHELKLKDLVLQYQLSEHIIFAGPIPQKELPAYYQLCDVFIMCSRVLSNRDAEGFGIVYLEANAFGKPVIAGRSGGVEDAVIHEQTGILVNPTETNEISQAIIKLLNNQSLANQLGQQGQQRALQQFQWSDQAKKVINILSNN